MRKILFTVIVAALTFTSGYGASKAVVASTIQLPEQELVYNEGIEMLKNGHYNEAIIKFTAAITIDSTFTKAYYNRAVAFFNIDKYNKAIADLEIAIRQFPEKETSDCYVLLSKASYRLGDIQEAIDYIDKALEIWPSNIRALLDKGGLLQISNQYEKAAEIYNSITYLTGGNVSAYNEQGNCFSELGDTDRAYECYRKAHNAAPDNNTLTYNFAIATWNAKKDTANAIKMLDNLIAAEPVNADYYNTKGYIYAQANIADSAFYYFDKAIELNKNIASAYNGKGAILCKSGLYSDAIAEFGKAIKANTNYGDAYINRGIAKDYIGDYDGACIDYNTGSELGAKNPQTCDKHLIPLSGVNTADNEYNPVLSPSGNRLSYTKSRTLKLGNTNETTFCANLVENEWVSDGCMPSKKKSSHHIDVADCGTSIYFSTKRRKGFGKQDLYVCRQGSNGKWSKPVNLGEKINTKYNEIAPELVGDSVLFFASDRDGGLGGYDIYYSKLINGEWSEPVNAGEPVNSDKDDAYYFQCPKKRDAFISSSRNGGNGGMDLYSVSYKLNNTLTIDLPKPTTLLSDNLIADINIEAEMLLDSTKITLVKGIVMGDDSLALNATVALSDNNLRQVIAIQEAEYNGAYQIILPGGSNYGIAVSHPGYMFHSENFDLPEQSEYKEISKNIVLKKIAVGKSVILKNMFYEVDKTDLSMESLVELENLIKLLDENPTMCLEIQGHTDKTGTKAYNKVLSEKRAQAVADYLIDKGIDPKRLSANGYGYDKPIAPNTTEEGRAENRRTEIVVTKI